MPGLVHRVALSMVLLEAGLGHPHGLRKDMGRRCGIVQHACLLHLAGKRLRVH